MPELKRRYGNFPKLSNAFTTVVAIVGAIGVWAIGHSALKNAEDFQIASHEAAAQSGATALSMVFSNALHREWESLQAVAENVDVSSPASMKSFADAVTEASNRVAWAGVANLHGKVVAGSNRIMEGSDVSEEGWFRKALKGPTVGQISEAPILGRGKDRTSKYIPMSVPLYSESGTLVGVVVYQMKLSWMTDYLSEAAMDLGLDLFVVDRSGKPIIIGNSNRSDALSQRTITQLDVLGTAAFMKRDENMSDAVAITGGLLPKDMPQKGWHLITRTPYPASSASLTQLRNEIWVFACDAVRDDRGCDADGTLSFYTDRAPSIASNGYS